MHMPLAWAFGTAPLVNAEEEADCHHRLAQGGGGALEQPHDDHHEEEGVENNNNFLSKARQATMQGLAALKRSLSGDGEGGAASSSSSSLYESSDVLGSIGYGEEDLQGMVHGAAQAVIATAARMKDEPPHLHAPELYEPQRGTCVRMIVSLGVWLDPTSVLSLALVPFLSPTNHQTLVTSYEEMRAQANEMLEAAKEKVVEVDVLGALEAMKEEVGGGKWWSGGGGRKNSLDNAALAMLEEEMLEEEMVAGPEAEEMVGGPMLATSSFGQEEEEVGEEGNNVYVKTAEEEEAEEDFLEKVCMLSPE